MKYLLYIVLPFLFASCSKSGDTPPAPVHRSVLVYMVANNSLGSSSPMGEQLTFDRLDLDEMMEARDQLAPDSRWLVYHAPYNGDAQLIELTQNGWKTLEVYPKASSVTLERFSLILKRQRELAPAEKYGIVLWSHASGWLENGIDEPEVTPQSFGEDGGRNMNITTLAYALRSFPMEFIYADCCKMAGVEVAYELRDCAELFAGSVIDLPARGMPYDLTLPLLSGGKVKEAAQTTFEYYKYTHDWRADNIAYPFCAISVIKLKAMDELAKQTAKAYGIAPENAPINMASLGYGTGADRYSDLRYYVEGLGAENFDDWKRAFENAVIYSDHLEYIDSYPKRITECCGLSTFILRKTSDSTFRNYNRLAWYTDVAVYQPIK